MVSVLANRRLSESAGAQLFFLPGEFETLTVVAGAVVKVEIPPQLRDFQAQWESPAVGLFHEAAFSTARLPTNSAKDPNLGTTVTFVISRRRFRGTRLRATL